MMTWGSDRSGMASTEFARIDHSPMSVSAMMKITTMPRWAAQFSMMALIMALWGRLAACPTLPRSDARLCRPNDFSILPCRDRRLPGPRHRNLHLAGVFAVSDMAQLPRGAHRRHAAHLRHE